MVGAGLPPAEFAVFTEAEPARAWARGREGQVAVKADGLARGKGVIVCTNVAAATAAIDAILVEGRFGRSGATIVVEERLEGPELSVLGVTDGKDVVALAPARDFKRAHDGDRGPNTGGMGAYSPPLGVDGASVDEVVEKVMRPALREMASSGDEFQGVLYAGRMLTSKGIRAIEFDARFCDPEAQGVLPRLASDFVALALASAKGTLASHPDLASDHRLALGVAVASANYPDDTLRKTGFPVHGMHQMRSDVLVFQTATA